MGSSFRRPLRPVALLVGSAVVFAAIFGVGDAALAQDAAPAPQAASVAAPAVGASAAQAAPLPQAVTRATWDSNFVYFVVQVDDSDVLGTASKPLSPDVAGDDSVAVYFQTGAERPDAPNAQTRAMIVSSAGGFQFLQGDTDKKTLVPLPLFSIKYGVSVQGTLNRSDDRDRGYVVSLAVPLSALGLDPKTLTENTEIGFNLVVRSRTAKGVTAASLAPGATANPVPAQWTKLRFINAETPSVSTGDVVIAPRVGEKATPPAIDGNYRAAAWPENSQFAVALPAAASAAPVVIAPSAPAGELASDSIAPTVNDAALKQGVTRFILARYLMGYQGDRRKTNLPTRGVWGKDDTLLLGDQPITGVGPWFSIDRVSYHKTQMTEMRRAGIDTALTQIGGPLAPLDVSIMDSKALLVLVAALREMTAQNLAAPTLSLMLDTSALLPVGAPVANVGTIEGREVLYQAIKRWFDMVPPELRAKATLPGSAGASGAFPVFFTQTQAKSQVIFPDNGDWASEIRKRFAQDYGPSVNGATLLFVGNTNAPGMAAALPTGAAGGAAVSAALPLFVVQPSGATATAGRGEGEAYTASWEAAFAAKPEWVVVDSWNDFTHSTEIAPSRQYGTHFADLTRILTVQATGLPPYAVQFPQNDVPRRMRPGQVVSATLSVKNTGATPLGAADTVSLVYRWKKGDTVVAENPLSLPLTRALLPTQTARIGVGLVAAKLNTTNGALTPLEPGNYTVEFDATRVSKTDPTAKPTPFATDANSDGPLRLPVTIAAALPDGVEFGASSLSPILVTGGTYAAAVRLRWLGDKPIAPDDARLVYQLRTADDKTVVLSGSIPLIRPLTPGAWETVTGPLALVDGGSPIAPACPELVANDGPSGYKLRWLLTRTNSTEAVPGERVETVAVYPESDEARITAPAPPDALKAGDLITMPVTVFNQGQTTWKKGQFSVACHWFYSDGAEAIWRPDVFAAINQDVKPGDTVKVSLPIRVPDRDGDFILAFDVLRAPDTFLSTRPVSRSGDLGLIPVRVLGGSLVFVDLTKQFNTDGTSGEETQARTGDLDGKGNAFPVESFPPDPFGIVAYLAGRDGATATKSEKNPTAYPSGYFSDFSPNARLVGFRYGQETLKSKNAVACQGQTVAVTPGKYFGLHLAALATGGKDAPLAVTLKYKDGTTTTVTRTVADWNRAPDAASPAVDTASSSVAVQTRIMRTRDKGDVAVPCVLHHIVVPVSPTKELESVSLPNDPNVKVFAITLER